jgi:biotin carboxylase
MTNELRPVTVLCIASYEKGHEFLRECRRQGCRVLLLTSLSLKGEAAWPTESIDEIFYMPDERKEWDADEMIRAVSYLARTEEIDLIVPLDDFDLEKAATLREHLRVPGLGETTTRHFRDKLAMRHRAAEAGIRVPAFAHALNRRRLEEFTRSVPGPWLLKPRTEASATGIKKINSREELWPALDALGDRDSFHLLERYLPGDIYHVDSIVSEREIVFAQANRYGHPPLDVAHGGGVFNTRTLAPDSEDSRRLLAANARVLEAMRLLRGVSHTEFIKAREDGEFYFLETAARVGGAHIVELIEAARGVNLWAEWAKIEIDRGRGNYRLPALRDDHAGLIVSLARQQRPDTSRYDDPEIVWRLDKPSHVGLIVRSDSQERVEQLLDSYARRFAHDFLATLPAADKPVS